MTVRHRQEVKVRLMATEFRTFLGSCGDEEDGTITFCSVSGFPPQAEHDVSSSSPSAVTSPQCPGVSLYPASMQPVRGPA